MPEVSRMEVNAAIERVIAGSDEMVESLRIIISYGHKLKKNTFGFEYTSNQTSGGSVSGYAEGVGNVGVDEDEREEVVEHSWGLSKERVGFYKLWKDASGRLVFQYFWRSDVSTQVSGEIPDEYYLAYNEKTLEPLYLGVLRDKVVFPLWIGLYFFLTYLKPIYGVIKDPIIGIGLKKT